MFYFFSGSFNFSGCTGCSDSNVTNVNTTDLTCDGSAPSSALGMGSTIGGNVLYGQCATNGTYWDSGGEPHLTLKSRAAGASRPAGVSGPCGHNAAGRLTGLRTNVILGCALLSFHRLRRCTQPERRHQQRHVHTFGEIVTDQVSLTGSGVIKSGVESAGCDQHGRRLPSCNRFWARSYRGPILPACKMLSLQATCSV